MTVDHLAELIEELRRSNERQAEILEARMHEWRGEQKSDYQRVLDEVYRSSRDISEDMAQQELRNDKERTAQRRALHWRLWRIEVTLLLAVALIGLIALEVWL